jgi:hypothetical protein
MKPARVAAAALLAGVVLIAIGLLALWVYIPVAGASLTLVAGCGLVGVGYRVLVRGQ